MPCFFSPTSQASKATYPRLAQSAIGTLHHRRPARNREVFLFFFLWIFFLIFNQDGKKYVTTRPGNVPCSSNNHNSFPLIPQHESLLRPLRQLSCPWGSSWGRHFVRVLGR